MLNFGKRCIIITDQHVIQVSFWEQCQLGHLTLIQIGLITKQILPNWCFSNTIMITNENHTSTDDYLLRFCSI